MYKDPNIFHSIKIFRLRWLGYIERMEKSEKHRKNGEEITHEKKFLQKATGKSKMFRLIQHLFQLLMMMMLI